MHRLYPYTIIRQDNISTTYVLHTKDSDFFRLAKFVDKSQVRLEEFQKEEAIWQQVEENGGCREGLVCFNYSSYVDIPTHWVLISQPLKGVTLETFFHERLVTLDYNCLRYIMYQILKTIGYMHDVLGIANLALELDTILIDQDTLKITVIDFFCGCFDTLCEKVDVCTQIYSPVLKLKLQQSESITFDDVKNADIFSIGTIFWYMLFCSYPFTQDVLQKMPKKRVRPEEMIKSILKVLDDQPPKACYTVPTLKDNEFNHLYQLTKDIIMCGLQHNCDTLYIESEGCRKQAETESIDEELFYDLSFNNVFREYNDYTKERMRGLLKQYVESLEPSAVTKEVDFVKENYIVLKQLGSGGQGSTSIVQDKRTGDQYILKLFKKELDFENELTNLRKINKNGCLDTLLCFQKQVVDEDNLQYGILTKVFDGVTLDKFIYDQIKTNTVIAIKDLTAIMKNVLTGLDYLHNIVNIAHVDLKPENILIDPKTMKTQIIDFGSACGHDNCRLVTTKLYQPPEMLIAPRRDQSLQALKMGDVFSLGLVFYLLANNSFPFPLFNASYRDNFYALLGKHDNQYKHSPKQEYMNRVIFESQYRFFSAKSNFEYKIDKIISAMLRYIDDKRISAAEALKGVTEIMEKLN